jgi:molybdenum cofactor cytidylyltransferase
MSNVAAIILAAGSSSRLGQTKQLLQFQGTKLIEGTINAARGAGCNPIIVVTGSNSPEVASAIKSEDICIAANPEWERGIGTSIRTGIQQLSELSPGIEAVALLVCDQPFVTANVVTDLIQLWSHGEGPIVASAYSETLGVPAVFAARFDELVHLPDDSGAKPVIMKNPERVAAFSFPEGAMDIDTAADCERLKKRMAP